MVSSEEYASSSVEMFERCRNAHNRLIRVDTDIVAEGLTVSPSERGDIDEFINSRPDHTSALQEFSVLADDLDKIQIENSTLPIPDISNYEFEQQLKRLTDLVCIALNDRNIDFKDASSNLSVFIRRYRSQYDNYVGIRIFDTEFEN